MSPRALGFIPGRAAKRDSNESPIVTALRAIGAVVVQHGGKDEPDLFVLHSGNWLALEVKQTGKQLTPGQQAFRSIVRACGSEVHVVRDVAEALKVVRGCAR